MAKDKKGRYEYPLSDHKGFIKFPYPLQFSHFKLWWQTVITAQKGKSNTDVEYIENPWLGCRDLIVEFGEWGIDDVPIGDVKESRVPLEVITWVKQCGLDYILDKLDPKEARLILSTFSVENQPLLPLGHSS